jgi:hypothetical protein
VSLGEEDLRERLFNKSRTADTVQEEAGMTTETVPSAREAVQKRYDEAVESFVARVRQDTHILAAILFGSLSYDEVWEHSDIDMYLIARDESAKAGPG